ncbi:unnamed protein product [Closterium sp. Naga37s-1]|nr:unnamed protein product [Closterium sp. Naga37s-1]
MQRVSEIELLTDDERRALRASRFSAERLLSPPRSSHSASAAAARQAHPGGPLATNKAAALSRFLQRRLAASGEGSKGGERGALDPRLVEVAVRNAQATLVAAASSGGGAVRHVDCFDEGDQGGGATDSSGSLSGFDEPVRAARHPARWYPCHAAGAAALCRLATCCCTPLFATLTRPAMRMLPVSPCTASRAPCVAPSHHPFARACPCTSTCSKPCSHSACVTLCPLVRVWDRIICARLFASSSHQLVSARAIAPCAFPCMFVSAAGCRASHEGLEERPPMASAYAERSVPRINVALRERWPLKIGPAGCGDTDGGKEAGRRGPEAGRAGLSHRRTAGLHGREGEGSARTQRSARGAVARQCGAQRCSTNTYVRVRLCQRGEPGEPLISQNCVTKLRASVSPALLPN